MKIYDVLVKVFSGIHSFFFIYLIHIRYGYFYSISSLILYVVNNSIQRKNVNEISKKYYSKDYVSGTIIILTSIITLFIMFYFMYYYPILYLYMQIANLLLTMHYLNRRNNGR